MYRGACGVGNVTRSSYSPALNPHHLPAAQLGLEVLHAVGDFPACHALAAGLLQRNPLGAGFASDGLRVRECLKELPTPPTCDTP